MATNEVPAVDERVLHESDRAVSAGSAVLLPGDSGHGIRNTSTGSLRFFYALAADNFADVEHRFS